MIYLSSTIIALLLYFLELSFLPHFSPWLVVPSLMLPFLAILSIKDRTIFPLILSVMLGLLLDTNTLNQIPVFTISFVIAITASKLFTTQFVSYGELRAAILVTSLGLLLLYGFDVYAQISSLTWSLSLLIPLIVGIALTYAVLAGMIIILKNYFDWVEKISEGRYR